MGWNYSHGLRQAWGGLHPTQTQPPHSAHAARLAAGMPRAGGRNFLLEDLPEKCHAGSDEERNLDGGGVGWGRGARVREKISAN